MRTGATAGDCGRLWLTLTKEYIPDLRMLIVPVSELGEPTGIQIEVVSSGIRQKDGTPTEYVWASASFFNQLHLISSGSLFELLISAHRKIDDFFTHGDAFAPVRRAM
jgi:hypothetical protein